MSEQELGISIAATACGLWEIPWVLEKQEKVGWWAYSQSDKVKHMHRTSQDSDPNAEQVFQ